MARRVGVFALAGIALSGLAVALVVHGKSSPQGRAGEAAVGEARTQSLKVALPALASDSIYAGPGAGGRPIVVIDAGHGGHDPGALAISGEVREKELTLALAQELRDTLVKRGRVRVAMTRDGDYFLPLEDRAAVARRLGASLFLSLHMDSAPNPLARGASVYSLSDVASDADAERFARVENASSGVVQAKPGTVQAMLAELVTRDQMNASADLAARMIRKAAGRVALRPEPHRFAAFHVLRRSNTPAALFEAGYLSNAEDEILLRSPEHRSAITLALAQAIEADIATRRNR